MPDPQVRDNTMVLAQTTKIQSWLDFWLNVVIGLGITIITIVLAIVAIKAIVKTISPGGGGGQSGGGSGLREMFSGMGTAMIAGITLGAGGFLVKAAVELGKQSTGG